MPLPAALLILAASLLPSEGQRPADTPRPIGTATIIGHVVDGTNDQRIGGVKVTIAGGGLKDPESTFADADGLFTFRALPAGRYSIGARRGGFLDASLGQRRPGGPSKPLVLTDDERRDDITIRMFRPAAITGTITDDAGEPVVKVAVRAYLRSFSGGHASLAAIDDALTDDRGIYRIGLLNPGDYVVAVPMLSATSETTGGRPGAPMIRDGGSSAAHLPPSDGKLQKFATTYYASGQTAAEATVITLGIGDLRRTVDIQLRPQKVVNISGSVTAAVGISRGVQVQLIAAREDELAGDRSTASVVAGDGGAFGFPAIPPGQYIIRASLRSTGQNGADVVPQWAEQSIAVSDKDLTDIALYLRRGFRVSGRIASDNASNETGDWMNAIKLTLDPASTRYVQPAPSASIDAAARTFSIANVMPGRYLARVSAPSGRMVKSVQYQGRDVTMTPFTLDASDVAGLVVTLSDRVTSLTGTVSGALELDTSSVLVFPQDPQSWTEFGGSPVMFRMLSVTSGGTFETLGLPAGDYLVVALDQDTAGDWQSPSFLQSAARVATHVRLGDGEKQVADLRIAVIR